MRTPILLATLATLAALTALGLLLAGCGGDEPAATTDAPPASSVVIPDDFPLADGYPADDEAELPEMGLDVPHRGAPIELNVCSEPLPLPPHDDLLVTGWRNIEDGRDRQLVSFADPTAATSYVHAVLDAHRACPVDENEGEGWATRTDLHRTELGDQSGAAATRETTGTGLTVTHVVRVGSTVLVSTTAGEGGAGPAGSIERQVRADGRAIARVVDAMGRLA